LPCDFLKGEREKRDSEEEREVEVEEVEEVEVGERKKNAASWPSSTVPQVSFWDSLLVFLRSRARLERKLSFHILFQVRTCVLEFRLLPVEQSLRERRRAGERMTWERRERRRSSSMPIVSSLARISHPSAAARPEKRVFSLLLSA
jgi:hypothetical protein